MTFVDRAHETQLTNVGLGDASEIRVDTFPRHVLERDEMPRFVACPAVPSRG